MATGTYDVLLRPFREVVKLGQLGQARAQLDPEHENNNALRVSARSLSNEGERALKKITPLLLHQTAEYSEFLLNLALHQDDITTKFRDIDVLLYDFEDFLDLDSFEKDKFDSLQVAIKGVAIILLDRLRRHAAESSLDEQVPPIAFVPLPQPTPAPKNDRSVTPAASRFATSRSRKLPMQTPQKPLPEPPRRTSAPQEAQPRNDFPAANSSAPRNGARPATSSSPARKTSAPDQSWYAGDETQTQHVAAYGNPARPQTSNTDTLRLGMERLDIKQDAIARQRPLSPDSLQSAHQSIGSSTFSPVHYRSSATISIPENDVPHEDSDWSPLLSKQGYPVSTASIAGSLGQLTERRNENSFHAIPGHYGRPHYDSSNGNAMAPATFDERQLAGGQGSVSPISDSGNTFGNAAVSRVSSIRESISSGGKSDAGGRVSTRSSTKARVTISGSLGPESSFAINKGFCRGAQKFLTEGPGPAVKKVGGQESTPGLGANSKEYQPEFHSMFSTPIGYTEPMAQCSHCEYKGVYSRLLQDMQQDPLANQQAHGLRYRLRFLYKSHVATRTLDSAYFACLFCSQMGATCRKSDATVFHSVDLLFRHLARHPIPLPDVPGVAVLYDALAPNQPGAEDFDLHFPNPAANLEAASALDDTENEMAQDVALPTARASKDHIQRRNEKPLARPGPTDPVLNALPVLQFLEGAKITQVDFPDRWEGKWCRGWHDGVFGVFPSKQVELESPQGLNISTLARSGRSAVARWKWDAKASPSSPWLKLGKGERITSITWDDPKAWYWIGTNTQGRTGIFPKSHIKTESVKDGTREDAPIKPSSKSQSGFSSLFGRKG